MNFLFFLLCVVLYLSPCIEAQVDVKDARSRHSSQEIQNENDDRDDSPRSMEVSTPFPKMTKENIPLLLSRMDELEKIAAKDRELSRDRTLSLEKEALAYREDLLKEFPSLDKDPLGPHFALYQDNNMNSSFASFVYWTKRKTSIQNAIVFLTFVRAEKFIERTNWIMDASIQANKNLARQMKDFQDQAYVEFVYQVDEATKVVNRLRVNPQAANATMYVSKEKKKENTIRGMLKEVLEDPNTARLMTELVSQAKDSWEKRTNVTEDGEDDSLKRRRTPVNRPLKKIAADL